MPAYPSESDLPMTGLPRSLVQAGHLSAAKADLLLKKSAMDNLPFIDVLLQSGEIESRALAMACTDIFGYPFIDLNAFNASFCPSQLIDARLQRNQRVAPLAKLGNRLSVAMSDPTNTQALDQIKFQTQMTVEPIVVEHAPLLRLIAQITQSAEQTLNDIVGGERDTPVAAGLAAINMSNADVDDAPVVRFLQKVLTNAINMGASDLHFEPFESFYRIRFRVDGVLRDIVQPPLAIKDKLASRIKVISNMDIAEKRAPQDGRLKLAISKTRAIDFRVSTLPTLHGEKVVMRILDSRQAQMGIDTLGYEPDQKDLLLDTIQRPYGMILVTGPTGSGKTVSLYACLNILNQPGINIATAEDPAEISLPGINQVNVNERAGLTFPVALRAFLRQDPDIIMVGEIRDLETADIAIKAAQTGHMVFSTLHTNDAPSTLTRLINMGIPPFNIAASVIMITAQRLTRRLCNCKQPAEIPHNVLLDAGFEEYELDDTWCAYQPMGCDNCSGTGYKGRVGLHQIMLITHEIERLILAQATSQEIEAQARSEGMETLRQAGLKKIRQGLTSLDEIISCTNL